MLATFASSTAPVTFALSPYSSQGLTHGYCPVAAQPDAKREKSEPSSETEADGKRVGRLPCVLPPRSASTKQVNHHTNGGNLEAAVL
jgi:hypothetical protein